MPKNLGRYINSDDVPRKRDVLADVTESLRGILPTDAVSNSVASFPDGANNVPVESLVVDINPAQDLHGYDSPWPAGGGKNKLDESKFANLTGSILYFPIYVGAGTFTMSTTAPLNTERGANLFLLAGNVSSGTGTGTNGVWDTQSRTVTAIDGYVTIAARNVNDVDPKDYKTLLEIGSSVTAYEPYSNVCPISGWTGANVYHSGADTSDPTVYQFTFPLGMGEIYGGVLDVTNGALSVDRGYIAAYNGETIGEPWISDRDKYAIGTTPTIGAEVVYILTAPITYQLAPVEVATLLGYNNIWADTGDVSIEYRADIKLYIDKKISALAAALS